MSKSDRKALSAHIDQVLKTSTDKAGKREAFKIPAPLPMPAPLSMSVPFELENVSEAPPPSFSPVTVEAPQKQKPASTESTVPPHGTVLPRGTDGFLKVPNILNFRVFPSLNPFDWAIYYHLYLLSHGFQSDSCLVGYGSLARSMNMARATVQKSILCLEKKGLLKRLSSNSYGSMKGTVYQVLIPSVSDLPDDETAAAPIPYDGTVPSRGTVLFHGTVPFNSTAGFLQVPNIINFRVLPSLDIFSRILYYHLYLLSHGFHKETCHVSLGTLAKSLNVVRSTVQKSIVCLEKRGLIKKLSANSYGDMKGSVYQVPMPDVSDLPDNRTDRTPVPSRGTVPCNSTVPPYGTVPPHGNNKERIIINNNKENLLLSNAKKAETASAVDEKPGTSQKLQQVREAYERLTGSRWRKTDTEAYMESGFDNLPLERIVAVLNAVKPLASSTINSFKYFRKELLLELNSFVRGIPKPESRIRTREKMLQIIKQVRSMHVGAHDFSQMEFKESVKLSCSRNGIGFDQDMFEELAG